MRGQFYSIIAILITLPVLLFTLQYLTYSQKITYGVSDRVISDQLHQLVASIEFDTKKAMEISGRRAIIAATDTVLNSGVPLTNAKANITALMLQGRINGTDNFMMINNTMPEWSYRITSNPVNFDVSLQYGNISVENYDGFSLRIGMDFNLTVTDRLKISKIEKLNSHKFVTVSIAGIEDPIFPLNTQGFVRRIIRPASPPYFVQRILIASSNSSGNCSGVVTFNKSECDTSKILAADTQAGVVFACYSGVILGDSRNLTGQTGCYVTGNSSSVSLVNQTVTSSGYSTVYLDGISRSVWSMPGPGILADKYYYRGNGPDFLMRLEGNYSPSGSGILSFIYAPEFEEQALPVDAYSRVDYLYFSGQGGCEKVRNTPDWFGIDSEHAAEFNITELLTGGSC